MNELIGLVIFIVVAILSIAQKFKEQRERRDEMLDSEPEADENKSRPDLDEMIPTASPRGAKARRAVSSAPQDVEDVIRQLMGQPARSGPPPLTQEAGEDEWQPAAPPIRREMPRKIQPPAPRRQPQQPHRQPAAGPHPGQQPPQIRPTRQRPARTPAELVGTAREARPRPRQETRTTAEVERSENERRWREEMERRKRSQKPEPQRKGKAARHLRSVSATSRRGLFHNLSDVRRAIILAEVIGEPRAMRDIEPRA